MIPQEKFIIQELGIAHLPESEQQEITESIRKHMQDLLIETTVENLTDTQINQFKSTITQEDVDEDAIMRITAGIPGIREKLEIALDTEWDIIKTSYQQIK